jgi:hypothetical protein
MAAKLGTNPDEIVYLDLRFDVGPVEIFIGSCFYHIDSASVKSGNSRLAAVIRPI